MRKTIVLFLIVFLTSCEGDVYFDSYFNYSDYTFRTLEEAKAYPDKVEIIRLEGEDALLFLKDFDQFKNLRYISLKGDSIRHLPSEIFSLPKLEYIDLWNTRLLPKTVDSLEMRYRDIGISYMPSTEMTIGYRESKGVDSNSLLYVVLYDDIPLEQEMDSLVTLNNIRKLDFTMVPNQPIPPSIGEFKDLYDIQLSNCQLETLPIELGKLKSVRDMNANDNRFTVLPESIYQLDSLKNITLWHNCLKYIGPKIANLKRLQLLFLDYNDLDSLPKEIGQLKELTLLSICENNLTTLPEEIKNCKHLKWLYIHNNNIPESERKKIREWLPNTSIHFEN